MIKSLKIRNLAVVENVGIEFQPGLNVITGETGAGKSILVGALGLALGDRADRDMIRSSESECSIEADFLLPSPSETDSILSELGIPPCEDGRLIVRRCIAASGGGRIIVNDASVTLQALKRIGDALVDFHGPHEHQSLIRNDFQLDALDDYGGLDPERSSFAEAYAAARELARKKDALTAGDAEGALRTIELLADDIREIEAAAPDAEDEESVLREHAVLGNTQRILELTQTITSALFDGENSAFSGIVTARQAIEELSSLIPNAAGWKQEAKSAAIQVQELSSDVAGFAHGIDQDPARLNRLDERLATYLALKRKYGKTVPEILGHLKSAKAQMEELSSRGERLKELEIELGAALDSMKEKGRKLAAKRREAAKRLSPSVIRELRALGFAQSSFEIALAETDASEDGMDKVEFLFAPNKGEPPRPVKAIASSGEISRLMLALKTALAEHARVPVMVFDEIDVNIGGVTAGAVGEKLARIAERRQVLCITHLPQVAVHGTAHFSVAKEVKKGRTSAGISLVEGEERVEEIARMLGGRDSTAVALRHARELLERTKKDRN